MEDGTKNKIAVEGVIGLANKIYGYARVSTREQNEERQIIALKEMGVPEKNIFIDKQTGKNFERPQYKKLLKKLDGETILYIKSIDRLGRSYRDLCEQWRIITKEKGADIVVLDMPILDTRKDKNLLGTFISDLILALLSYVAESEYDLIHKRQAEGIAAAKARGVKMGRPPRPLPDNFHEVYQEWKHKKISVAKAAEECGMPQTTFYDRAKAFEKKRIDNN
ncbi:recombinase family protein [Pseudobutyrivibrio sp.]|uniref:recombinase family protein n=1 Tax=Pseudobutyrivibrio sp. TaxID=2014367 RepID=UPI00386B40F9